MAGPRVTKKAGERPKFNKDHDSNYFRISKTHFYGGVCILLCAIIAFYFERRHVTACN
jgi:hypothetical protein